MDEDEEQAGSPKKPSNVSTTTSNNLGLGEDVESSLNYTQKMIEKFEEMDRVMDQAPSEPGEDDEMEFQTEEEENQDFKNKFADILKELDLEDDQNELLPLTMQEESQIEYGGPGEQDLDEMIGYLEGDKEKKVEIIRAYDSENNNITESTRSTPGKGKGDKMVVLGPDHPKMKRFQAALKEHLERQIFQVDCQLREQESELKNRKEERTTLGATLYNLQHDMLRQTQKMESLETELKSIENKRETLQEEIETERDAFECIKSKLLAEQEKERELQKVIKTLDFSEHVIKEAAEKFEGELKIRQLIDDKIQKMREKSEAEKRNQDFYLDKVLTHVHQMEQVNAGIQRQIMAHKEEQVEINSYITEGRTEIEALQIEKLHLQRAWNDTIAVVRARDEALRAARETLRQRKEELRIQESELRSLSHLIAKEQEKHERASILVRRRRIEEKILSKQYSKMQADNEELREKLVLLNKVKQNVEQDMLRANNMLSRKKKEVNLPRKRIETLAVEKNALEDAILAAMQERTALDKAAAHIALKVKEARQKTRSMESEVAKVENDMVSMTVEVEKLRGVYLEKKQTLEELEKKLAAQDKVLQEQSKDMKQSERMINRKTREVELLNKKLKKLIDAHGGVEMSPMEREISDLERQMAAEKNSVIQLQEEWLKRQDELVKLTVKRDSIVERNELLRKEVFIMDQKRVRLEKELERRKEEMNKMNKETEKTRQDMIAANAKLHEDRVNHNQMDRDNQLIQTELISFLKESEMESLELEQEVKNLEQEKESLLATLQEAHAQNLQWEKKVHLAKELKDSLKKEMEGSTSALKLAIHHMSVRYHDLLRAQEKLMGDLEQSIEKRDRIIQQADLNLKRANIHPKKTKLNIQRNFNQLKERNRLLVKETTDAEQEIQEMMSSIQEYENYLKTENQGLKEAQESIKLSEEKISEAAIQKHKNLLELILRQQKYKVLETVKLNRYKPLTKNERQYECELQKYEAKCYNLAELGDLIMKEFPEATLHAKLIKASILPGTS